MIHQLFFSPYNGLAEYIRLRIIKFNEMHLKHIKNIHGLIDQIKNTV